MTMNWDDPNWNGSVSYAGGTGSVASASWDSTDDAAPSYFEFTSGLSVEIAPDDPSGRRREIREHSFARYNDAWIALANR